MVLGKTNKTAEAFLDEKVTHAVVTVPVYFNDAELQDAGTLAGLNILQIVSRLTAAANAYGLDKENTHGADESHIMA